MDNFRRLNPKRAVEFLNNYMGLLAMKKRVALFRDYKSAKEDLMMEIMDKTSADNYASVEVLVNMFEEITDMEEWYNNLN